MVTETAQIAAARRPSSSSWKRRLGTAAGVVLGLVLLIAAWGKAIDPAAFAEQIHAEGLDGLLPAAAVALAALALEAGLGLALVAGLRRGWVLLPAVLLVGFFLFLTGRAEWRSLHGTLPDSGSCGCFGNLVERSAAEALWQDVALLALPLALAFLGREERGGVPWRRLLLVGAGVAGVMLLAWKAPALPLDDLATRLAPGVELAKLCTGAAEARVCLTTVVPELATGEHLVVLADLAGAELLAALPQLNAYAETARTRRLWVLSDATPEEHSAFFWRHGPAFDLREVPAALLRPLYRRLPRSFLVRDGRVVETWPGLPPLDGNDVLHAAPPRATPAPASTPNPQPE